MSSEYFAKHIHFKNLLKTKHSHHLVLMATFWKLTTIFMGYLTYGRIH